MKAVILMLWSWQGALDSIRKVSSGCLPSSTGSRDSIAHPTHSTNVCKELVFTDQECEALGQASETGKLRAAFIIYISPTNTRFWGFSSQHDQAMDKRGPADYPFHSGQSRGSAGSHDRCPTDVSYCKHFKCLRSHSRRYFGKVLWALERSALGAEAPIFSQRRIQQYSMSKAHIWRNKPIISPSSYFFSEFALPLTILPGAGSFQKNAPV